MSRTSNPRSVSLQELIDAEDKAHPGFALGVEAVANRRALLHALASRRRRLRLSQREVARRIGCKQPALSRLETGNLDPHISTLLEYALVLGWSLALVPSAFPTRVQPRRRSATIHS